MEIVNYSNAQAGTHQYAQTGFPDKATLSRLVLTAKGAGRTMAAFSAACGISTSSLSRMVNGKITRPISLDTLQKIYDARDSECKIDFAQFMQANGMTPASGASPIPENDEPAWMNTPYARETEMLHIITDELMARGIALQYCRTNRPIPPTDDERYAPFATLCPDVELRVSEGEKSCIWAFEMISKKIPSADLDEHSVSARTSSCIRAEMPWLLLDAWFPEQAEDRKISFVFCDETYYNAFLLFLSDAPLHHPLSLVFIDLTNKKVKEEVVLNAGDLEYLFQLPVLPVLPFAKDLPNNE